MLSIGLIGAYRRQHLGGRLNKFANKKIVANSNGVKIAIFIKQKIHLFIGENDNL